MMSINETLVYGSRTERNIRQSKSITAVKDVFCTTTAYVLYYANGQQIALRWNYHKRIKDCAEQWWRTTAAEGGDICTFWCKIYSKIVKKLAKKFTFCPTPPNFLRHRTFDHSKSTTQAWKNLGFKQKKIRFLVF